MLSSIQKDDLLVFSGSLMKGMPANYIAQIEKKLQQLNIRFKLCVDTSGKALVETYQHTQPFLIKINDEEIKDIFPEKKLNTPADYLDLLRNDVKKSIANFVITLGKEGIVARMNNQLYTGFAEPIEAKNPIACGDFFLGRLINGLNNVESTIDTLRSALLFSICNVLNWYPEVMEEQLDSLFPTISVTKL